MEAFIPKIIPDSPTSLLVDKQAIMRLSSLTKTGAPPRKFPPAFGPESKLGLCQTTFPFCIFRAKRISSIREIISTNKEQSISNTHSR